MCRVDGLGFRIEGERFRVSVLKLEFKVFSLHVRVLYTPIKGSISKLKCWAFGIDSSSLEQECLGRVDW